MQGARTRQNFTHGDLQVGQRGKLAVEVDLGKDGEPKGVFYNFGIWGSCNFLKLLVQGLQSRHPESGSSGK